MLGFCIKLKNESPAENPYAGNCADNFNCAWAPASETRIVLELEIE